MMLVNAGRRFSFRLFHGTDRVFDRFDLAYCGSQAGRATNGHLGVWLSTGWDLARRCAGPTGAVLEVELVSSGCFEMSIAELMHHHDLADRNGSPREYYSQLRRDLLGKGCGAIAICERDGSVHMYVALDPQSLEIVGRHPAHDGAGVPEALAMAP